MFDGRDMAFVRVSARMGIGIETMHTRNNNKEWEGYGVPPSMVPLPYGIYCHRMCAIIVLWENAAATGKSIIDISARPQAYILRLVVGVVCIVCVGRWERGRYFFIVTASVIDWNKMFVQFLLFLNWLFISGEIFSAEYRVYAMHCGLMAGNGTSKMVFLYFLMVCKSFCSLRPVVSYAKTQVAKRPRPNGKNQSISHPPLAPKVIY